MKWFKDWRTYITLLNTFLCVLALCWCFIKPSNQWQDVYMIRCGHATYSVSAGYECIKIRKQGDKVYMKIVWEGETIDTYCSREDVQYIDYL